VPTGCFAAIRLRLQSAAAPSSWAINTMLGHTDPRMTARYAHVVDMAKRNPALFIPVKVG
jgi:integrase